jgi:ATP-dependent Clp protease ATP-binding subunit ClpC
MTSNAGVELIKHEGQIGFAPSKSEAQVKRSYEDMKKKVMTEIQKSFRPEFLNRLDDIIVFHELSEEQLRSIVDLMVVELQERLKEHNLSIELTDKAKSWLAREGYDPIYGARPLRRVIERHVENPLSSKLLRGELEEGETIKVDLGKDGLTFKTKKGAAAAA